MRLARAATTALVVGCVVVGTGWSSVAVASYQVPPFVFTQPATNPTLAAQSRIFDASAGDASGTRVVLYGGEAPGSTTARADTWVNEADGTWRPMCGTSVAGATAACGPGARAGMGMADAPGGVILYGGFADSIGGGGNPPDGDTWRWNGSTWSRVCTAATCGPGARALMSMAGNGTSAVMFGGIGNSGILDDTWVFDGSGWTQTCGQTGSPCGPSGLAAASMAWDGDHYVLFGGADLNGSGAPVDDTWVFDGTRWTKVCGTSMGHACGPEARGLGAFAFANNPDDSMRGAVLAEGGDIFGSGTTQHLDRDAWFFDGAVWTRLDPPWNAAPVSWPNSGSPPAGPDPLIGTMAAKPALCEAVYLGAAVTVSANQPTLRGKTFVVGRPESSCRPSVLPALPPAAQPVVAPAPNPVARDPAAVPAATGPSLAMTGPHALVPSALVGLLLLASGALLLVVTGARRRAVT